MGSSEELPLVSTIGQAVSRISRWCRGVYGSITPSWRLPGATAAATPPPCRRGSKTIGRRLLTSSDSAVLSTSQSSRATARPATMIAKGLSSRCLRSRSAAAAPSLPARSEEHTSELQSRPHLVCRLLLEKKNTHANRDPLPHPETTPT